jgi:site-specific DNA-methyltransferase (adenine-specific)
MPKEHKAVMKHEVAVHFIKNFTQENDIILDCFLGHGTTAVVCDDLNRKCIGIELKEFYLDMSKKRVEENKRKKANKQ